MIRARVLLLIAVLPFVAAVPVQAKFRLCNKTDHALIAAIGYHNGRVWKSEGWWKVEPRGCTDILRGALNARYYYLRGVHVGVDGAWDGNRFFCVAADNFTIKGREHCSKRGYAQAGFFEIDTHDMSTWVQNLSD
ncbi:MAG: DUF1036 domain-containing protein [Alphaproteobacteria bacterium]|nr:DUF1036 domain-containing protein [Alphaproteobacteria bacterium]